MFIYLFNFFGSYILTNLKKLFILKNCTYQGIDANRTASLGSPSPKSSLALLHPKGLSLFWSPFLSISWPTCPRSSLVWHLFSNLPEHGYRPLPTHVRNLQCTSAIVIRGRNYASSPSASARRSHMWLAWSSRKSNTIRWIFESTSSTWRPFRHQWLELP